MQNVASKLQPNNEVPGLKGLPLVGNLPQFQRQPLATPIKAARECGDVARIDLASQRYYLLSNPEHVRHVLQDNNKNYIKGYGKVRVLLGDGLVLSEGSFWRRQRRLMQPAFHRRRLARFAEVMTEETAKMLDGWEARVSGGRPLDVAMEMTLLTQRIIVKTMFGEDVGAEGGRIARAFETALAGIETRFLIPLWITRLPLPANRRFENALRTIDDAVHRIIGERRCSGREGGDDLLSMLMEARDEETGETMSDRQIRDEVTTIYLAGHETTAVTLSWTWYLLSKSPEVARRVHEEVSRILGERTPGIEDLPNLTYTRMVLDETLRLYPAAWMISRTAVEEDEIGGYRIPAGHTLLEPLRHPPPNRPLAQPRRLRPRAFRPRRRQRSPTVRLLPFRRRPAPVHWQQLRADGGDPDSSHDHAALPAGPNAWPDGRGAPQGNPAPTPGRLDDAT